MSYSRHLRSLLTVVLLSFSLLGKGQEIHDVGVQCGASSYLGDFNHINIFKSPSYYIGGFYRRLFSEYSSLRLTVGTGKISGSSSNLAYYLPNNHPSIDFGKSYLNLDVKYEVNFCPFNPLKSKDDFFSPYLLVGIGCYFYNSNFVPAIPFGAGVKIAGSRRLTLGVELQLSKTFYDKLDGYSNLTSDKSVLLNNDWFVFYGFMMSYRLKLGQKTCPAYL